MPKNRTQLPIRLTILVFINVMLMIVQPVLGIIYRVIATHLVKIVDMDLPGYGQK